MLVDQRVNPQLQVIRISRLDMSSGFLCTLMGVPLTFVQHMLDDWRFLPNQPESINTSSILEEMGKLNEFLLVSLGKCLSLRIKLFKPHAIDKSLIHIIVYTCP